MALTAGTRIGPYEILASLGAGGMGEVYRARDERLRREVAIKVVPASYSQDSNRLRRFEQEAQAAGGLNHPNILAVHHFGTHEGAPYIVTELLEGETLRARLAGGSLAVRKAVEFAVQIAGGLAVAHEKGIVHRDLKPENLFLTKDGRLKILDFGLAKLTQTEGTGGPQTNLPTASAGTEPGVVMGTLSYMSPEQVKGHPADQRSDIFSLGVILYEMLSARRAFHRDSAAETISAILREEPPDLSAINRGVQPGLERIVRHCLEKSPEERFQSARDLSFALEGVSASSDDSRTGEEIVTRPRSSHHRRATSWENPIAGARFTRLTDFEGSELDAVISADGKFVAFLSDRDGPFDLLVGQVGGPGFVNLTNGRYHQLFSEGVRNIGFTPDGTHIWVHMTSENLTEHSVVLVPTLGGFPRPFLPTAVSVAWSPDGVRAVYHEAIRGDPVFLADRNGGNPKLLFHDEPGAHWHYPTWSADGRFVVFTRGLVREKMDVWRIPAAGGEPVRLTHHDSQVSYPAALDPRTLVYCARIPDGTPSALYAMDVEAKVPHRATAGLEEYISIAASADGRRLVATVANPSKSLWTAPIKEGTVTEAEVTRLPIPAVRAAYPRWGPDYLLFLSSRGGADGLWMFREGRVAELWNPSGGAVIAAPAISPDNRTIAFVARSEGRARLLLMASDGTNARPIAESLDIREAPSWSPDSRYIAVSAHDGTADHLFRVPVNGDPPVRLADGVVFSPVWSPNGQIVIFSVTDMGAVRRVKAVTDEGTPFPLPDLSVLWTGDRYRFLPDGRSLVILKGKFRRQDFWLFDLESGEEHQLTSLRPGYEQKSFDVSRDGRQIVFDRVKENSDIALIERVVR